MIFLINVPIALATLALVSDRWVEATATDGHPFRHPRRDPLRHRARVARRGLHRAADARLGDPFVVGAIAGGAALLAVFVVYELHTPMPMLPLHLFRLRNFCVANIETFSVYGASPD